jgi:transposase-like protein
MSKRDRTKRSGASGSSGGSGRRGPGSPRTHPVELRLRVVREVVDEGAPIVEVARIFGLAVTTINDWVKRYRLGGLDRAGTGHRTFLLGREEDIST